MRIRISNLGSRTVQYVPLPRMRSSLVVRASDCQCTSCNGPGFDPSAQRNLRGGRWSSVEYSTMFINPLVLYRSDWTNCSVPWGTFTWSSSKSFSRWDIFRIFQIRIGCLMFTDPGSTFYFNVDSNPGSRKINADLFRSGDWYQLTDQSLPKTELIFYT